MVLGTQSHKDTTGSEGIVHPNSIQTMSAGTGIMHSEFNASETEPFHCYQIWVFPKELNVKPRHETFVANVIDFFKSWLQVFLPIKYTIRNMD